MDERARKIFQEAYATLDRTADIPRNDEREREISDYIESCLELDFTPREPRRRKKLDRWPREETAAWAEWCDARINAAFESYSESVGIAIATINKRTMKAFNAQIRALENEVRSLKAQVETLRHSNSRGILQSGTSPNRALDLN